jgi:hypothetical protein
VFYPEGAIGTDGTTIILWSRNGELKVRSGDGRDDE